MKAPDGKLTVTHYGRGGRDGRTATYDDGKIASDGGEIKFSGTYPGSTTRFSETMHHDGGRTEEVDDGKESYKASYFTLPDGKREYTKVDADGKTYVRGADGKLRGPDGQLTEFDISHDGTVTYTVGNHQYQIRPQPKQPSDQPTEAPGPNSPYL